MENNCPKCSIDLSNGDLKSIKNRDREMLGLKILFGECSLKNDILEKDYCDLCGASGGDIVLGKLLK